MIRVVEDFSWMRSEALVKKNLLAIPVSGFERSFFVAAGWNGKDGSESLGTAERGGGKTPIVVVLQERSAQIREWSCITERMRERTGIARSHERLSGSPHRQDR
jgi:hypothetical protein